MAWKGSLGVIYSNPLESFRLERNLKKSPSPSTSLSYCVPLLLCPLVSPKCLQGWGPQHCPGQHVPMPDHPLHEEILPDIRPKPPLCNFRSRAEETHLPQSQPGQSPFCKRILKIIKIHSGPDSEVTYSQVAL